MFAVSNQTTKTMAKVATTTTAKATTAKATTAKKELTLKEVILKRIKKDFGMSFAALKKEVLKTLKNYGGSDSFDSKEGYEVFYSTNTNCAGGAGFYAVVNMPKTFKRYVKLS